MPFVNLPYWMGMEKKRLFLVGPTPVWTSVQIYSPYQQDRSWGATGSYYVGANAWDNGGHACTGSPYCGSFPCSGFSDCGVNDYVGVEVLSCPPSPTPTSTSTLTPAPAMFTINGVVLIENSAMADLDCADAGA